MVKTPPGLLYGHALDKVELVELVVGTRMGPKDMSSPAIPDHGPAPFMKRLVDARIATMKH